MTAYQINYQDCTYYTKYRVENKLCFLLYILCTLLPIVSNVSHFTSLQLKSPTHATFLLLLIIFCKLFRISSIIFLVWGGNVQLLFFSFLHILSLYICALINSVSLFPYFPILLDPILRYDNFGAATNLHLSGTDKWSFELIFLWIMIMFMFFCISLYCRMYNYMYLCTNKGKNMTNHHKVN